MNIQTNVPLKNYTTMKLGGPAKYFAEAKTPSDIMELCNHAQEKNMPIFTLGGGSNLIGRDEGYEGLVIHIRIPGFQVIEDTPQSTTLKIGAGEIWDSVVERSVAMNLSGIEAMSAIPGTAGAAPVQNVGAYGQEIAETLVSLEAYDKQTNSFVVISNEQCEFSYRHSIFRGSQTGRYIIVSITLKLSKNFPAPPFYETLQAYFDQNNISQFTHKIVRNAVIAIRSNKLPDPTKIANSGSFFKNSIIEKWQADELRQKFPDMKMFDMASGDVKVPSGWLIEKVDLKGKQLGSMRVYENNALVLVNDTATTYKELADAREHIIRTVHDAFQILIEQEPLEITP